MLVRYSIFCYITSGSYSAQSEGHFEIHIFLAHFIKQCLSALGKGDVSRSVLLYQSVRVITQNLKIKAQFTYMLIMFRSEGWHSSGHIMQRQSSGLFGIWRVEQIHPPLSFILSGRNCERVCFSERLIAPDIMVNTAKERKKKTKFLWELKVWWVYQFHYAFVWVNHAFLGPFKPGATGVIFFDGFLCQELRSYAIHFSVKFCSVYSRLFFSSSFLSLYAFLI